MFKKFIDLYQSSLYRNAFFLVLNSVIMSGFGFLFWSLNTRFFDSNDVGLALTLISSMSLIGTISLLGFDDALIRFIGKSDKKNVKISAVYSLCIISSLIFSVIFVIFIKSLAPGISLLTNNYFFMALFIIFTIIWTLFILTDGIFIAFRESKYTLIKNSIFSVLKLLLPFVLFGLGFVAMYYSWTIAAIIALLITILLVPKKLFHKPRISVNFDVIKHMFLFSFSNYIMRILLSAPGLLLPLIITNSLSAEKTAYFYVAWMISDLISVIPNSISMSFFAEASYEEGDINNKIKKAIKISYIFIIPILIFVLLFSNFILGFFGESYASNSSSLLKILAIASIPAALNTLFITVNKVRKNIKKLIFVGVYFFVVFLSLVFILVKRYDILGVGIAWLITNIIFSLFVLIKTKGLNYENA